MLGFYCVLKLLLLLKCLYFVTSKKYALSHCRNQNKLITTVEEDFSQLIEAEPGDTLKLACHYCHEADNGKAKVWTKLNYLQNDASDEINFSKAKRFRLQRDNSLLIKTIQVNDSGLYACRESTNQDDENKYIYYVDVVVVELYDQGSTENWKSYVDKFMKPMNEQFRQSQLEDYVYLRDVLGVQINVTSEWESKQSCDGCTGISKRKAFCRLHPIHKETVSIS